MVKGGCPEVATPELGLEERLALHQAGDIRKICTCRRRYSREKRNVY